MTPIDERFGRWMAALEARHLADLTFPEVTRALRALSSTYVERRERLGEGAALEGAGKRAAFALFYGPLHFLLVREIVRALGAASGGARPIVDLGCGTGAAGAAWAVESPDRRRVIGIDRHPWAVAEAIATYRAFDLSGQTRRGDAASAVPRERADLVAAFTVNEIQDESRAVLRDRLLEAAARGSRVLVVEPLAKSAVRWWSGWRDVFVAAGGREDEWRFHVELPPMVAKLDRAAGLDHRELTGRSLLLGKGTAATLTRAGHRAASS